MLARRLEGKRGALAAAAVVLAAVLPFAATLGHGFALDDVSEVVRNEHVHSLVVAPRLFAEGAWDGAGDVNPIYRPLTSFTYALNHAAGGLAPAGYHLVNLLLHSLCAMLVLRLGLALGGSLLAATAAALLFAVHPAHVEVVANVAGRKDALAALFAFLTLLGHRVALARGGARLALPWLAFAAALFSKESGAVALGIVGAWDLLVEPSAWRAQRRRAGLLYAGYLLLLALYFLARRAAVGSFGVPLASIPFVENPLAHLPIDQRVLTAVAVLGRGLALLAWPSSLSPDYSWNAIPPVTSPLDPRFLLALLAIAALATAAFAIRRSRPSLTFLALWYAGAAFLTSNLLVPVGTIFGERLLYLPSVAFCLAAGLLSQPWLARPQRWPRVAAALLLLALAIRSVVYAGTWRDEVALFTEAVASQPGSAKAHDLLGAALMEVGRDEEGARELERGVAALQGSPEPPQAQRIKLGVAWERLGRLPDAEALYLAILRQTPDYPDALWRLGVVRWQQGRLDEAARLWERTVVVAPDHARALTDLGLARQARGDLAGAEALWLEAARIDPRTSGPWLSLGDLYAARGDVARARHAWQRFLELARYGVYPGERERVEDLLRRTDPAPGAGR